MQKVPDTSILTQKELCERWNVTPGKIYKLEDEGKLKRLEIGAYYSTANVLRLEGEDEDSISVYEYERLKRELKFEREENQRLYKLLRDINRLSTGGEILEIRLSEE